MEKWRKKVNLELQVKKDRGHRKRKRRVFMQEAAQEPNRKLEDQGKGKCSHHEFLSLGELEGKRRKKERKFKSCR